MSPNNIAIVTLRRNDYRINFWFMTWSAAVSRMKNADLGAKSRQLWLRKKLFLIVMSNNTSERWQNSKDILKGTKKDEKQGEQYYKENKERQQKWLMINTDNYFIRPKIRKKNMQEIDTRICLTGPGKN